MLNYQVLFQAIANLWKQFLIFDDILELLPIQVNSILFSYSILPFIYFEATKANSYLFDIQDIYLPIWFHAIPFATIATYWILLFYHWILL